MEKEDKIPEQNNPDKHKIDISHKLTADDIDKIEKYRQTRKTSVLTILFTDIVGYTGFTYEAGEAVSAKFRHIHDEIIIKQINDDGHGEIIKQIGDSFLIVFSDPTIAVKQALKLQSLFQINSDNLTHKDYILKIRMGLHMGQVSVEDHIVTDVFGTHVNLASRVMALAKAGQVLVSGSVWENASGWLKDEQETKVQSIYYGKIKLKGIGKPTDIYEFYTETYGKAGIPNTLLKIKQKLRAIRVASLSLLLAVIMVPLFFLLKQKPGEVADTIENNRGKIILADIDSYDEDIEFCSPFGNFNYGIYTKNKYSLETIEPETIFKLNERYQELLKTNFIAEFDIETEGQIKLEYAKNGYTVPLNFRYDSIIRRQRYSIHDKSIIYSSINIIIPHLYKYKEEDRYYLLLDLALLNYHPEGSFQTSTCPDKVLTDIDSVPHMINVMIDEILNTHKKQRYSKGKIVKVNGDDVLVKFKRSSYTKTPVPGVILTTTRHYKPWTQMSDSGVIRRINDLEKVLEYYGTPEEWIKKIDTIGYSFWSYREYRNLKDSAVIFGGATGHIFSINIDLKLIEAYDSTALARIHYKHYPWVELEVGDDVELK